jgi:hypothetical protein
MYIMKRTQLYLDENIWEGLHVRAKSENTTISDLVRRAIEAQYFSNLERRAKAMKAIIGIRPASPSDLDSTEEVRLLREGDRFARLFGAEANE